MATTKSARVSNRLRQAVWEARGKGIKQHELARAAGVNVSVFSSLVHDHFPIDPTDERVRRIADLLGLDPSDAIETR